MNKPRLLISGDDANFLDMHVQIRESKINKVKLAVDKASAVGDMASANSHAKSVETPSATNIHKNTLAMYFLAIAPEAPDGWLSITV